MACGNFAAATKDCAQHFLLWQESICIKQLTSMQLFHDRTQLIVWPISLSQLDFAPCALALQSFFHNQFTISSMPMMARTLSADLLR
jgi:hypothetical protein